MTKLNTLLLVILMACSLYLVKTAYESRNLFVQLDRARNEERTLDIAYGRLELDKRAEATPLRVEKVAREKLGMRTVTPAVTQYVTYPATGAAAATNPAAPAPATPQPVTPAPAKPHTGARP
ncbi:MAG: cell division protein FtsL [Rhizobacter sp.]|nr:cell division protein FtsL [Rhizobacter sp.]